VLCCSACSLCYLCILPPQNPTTTNKRAHTHASHLRSFRSDVCRHDVQPMAAPGRRRPHAHALRSPPMISSDDPRSDAEPTGGGGQPSPNANPASVHARASRWALSTSGWVLRRLLLCVAEFEELLRTVDQTMRNKPLLPTPTPPLSGSRALAGISPRTSHQAYFLIISSSFASSAPIVSSILAPSCQTCAAAAVAAVGVRSWQHGGKHQDVQRQRLGALPSQCVLASSLLLDRRKT